MGNKRVAITAWLSLLLALAACGLVIAVYGGSLWSADADLAHHYALVTRIEQHGWSFPTPDPSLGEMNIYPRTAHALAAMIAPAVGSPLVGMQLVALGSLAVLWGAIGWMLASLPRRALLVAAAAAATLLLANRYLIHLELFGRELIGNYFFAQLVAEAAAMMALAAALSVERAGRGGVPVYLGLGGAVLLVEQVHALPALELLAVLVLIVLLNAMGVRGEDRKRTLIRGLVIAAVALVVMLIAPAFRAMAGISQNDGLLDLRYTSTAGVLAIECILVLGLSALLMWRWMRFSEPEARRNGIVLKYLGAFGAAVAGVALLQLVMLNFGFGSWYACKKYAFGLNTVLIIDLAVLLVSPKMLEADGWHGAVSSATNAFRYAFPGIFALAACVAVLPLPASQIVSVAEVVQAERFAYTYRDPHPGSTSGIYDYAIGMFGPQHGLDYLISIGVLEAPRDRNTYALLGGAAPSKQRKVGRIFTREGSVPWDVVECRILATTDGFAILDGACVLGKVATSQ